MSLLNDIETFITNHGLTERKFGELSMNDKNLVPQLRGDKGSRPRRLWPENEARIRSFIASYKPAPQQNAA